MHDPWPQYSPVPYLTAEPDRDAAERAPLDQWGWLEVFVLVQLLWGLMLFVPGTQAYRAYIRAFPYVASLAALGVCMKATRTETRVPGARWIFCVGFLLAANLMHESTHVQAGIAQMGFYLSIAAPMFWASRIGQGEARLRRVVWLIFLGSFASAAVGVLQVYYPTRFLPPEFSSLALSLNPEFVKALSYIGPDGQRIVRPPGLSDLPGGAAMAGMTAALLGVALGSQSQQRWPMRCLCLGAAGVGMTVLYLTQVRSLSLMAVIAMLAFAGMRLRQGHVVQSGSILVAVGAIVLSSFVWALTLGGQTIYERFFGLIDSGIVGTFQETRGIFLNYTFSELLYEFPLGAGLGRWGMMQVYFGDPAAWQYRPIHVEIQVTGWLLDGGVLMWLFYGGALLAAMRYSYRLTLDAPGGLRDLAGTVFCVQLMIVGLCFAGPVFNTQLGLQFWLLTTVLYGAGQAAMLDTSEADGEDDAG